MVLQAGLLLSTKCNCNQTQPIISWETSLKILKWCIKFMLWYKTKNNGINMEVKDFDACEGIKVMQTFANYI